MTREEFVKGYMTRSDFDGYRLEGERVYFDDGKYWCALPCQCGEEGCEGWAMVPPETRGWHLFQDGPDEGRPSYEEATRADMAYMRGSRDSDTRPKAGDAKQGSTRE